MRKYRQKLQISSLEAAICNVALFKSMKEKEFKDEIYVSYSEDGVTVEANDEREWQRVANYVNNFLSNKKIGLLTHGYDRDTYQELIVRGLKEYTRRVKEQNQECPYINIIHYQKLRKSCEYMDKQKYLEPLRDWERKQKLTPNFAFLIVDPSEQFEQVKASLLEHLLKRTVTLQILRLSLLQFVSVYYSAVLGPPFKEACTKKLIEATLEKQNEKYSIRLVNYSQVKINQWECKVFGKNYNCSRLGLDYISSKDIEPHINSIKSYLRVSKADGNAFQELHQDLLSENGGEYFMMSYKKIDREKTLEALRKIEIKGQNDPKYIKRQIQKQVVCSFEQIEFVSLLGESEDNQYIIHKVCINSCPYMVHQYNSISPSSKESFSIYLEQLNTYSCTYLVRYYGIAIKEIEITKTQETQHYFVIFDYHHRTVDHMLAADMILDNFQAGNMVLHFAYLMQVLHLHDEPRCLGSLSVKSGYWPPAVVLPYLPLDHTLDSDVKLLGIFFEKLLLANRQAAINVNEDYFGEVLKMMLKEQRHQRITLTKCILLLQELLVL